MGRSKAALPFGPESMLGRVVRVAGLISDDVFAVGHADLSGAGMIRRLDDPGEGPLVALATALRAARHPQVLLLACDMPLVTPGLLGHLHSRVGDARACVPCIDGIAIPTCAIYRTDVVDAAEALVVRGARSLRALLEVIAVRWVDEGELRAVDPDLVSFIDCDTPEEYERALGVAGFADTRD